MPERGVTVQVTPHSVAVVRGASLLEAQQLAANEARDRGYPVCVVDDDGRLWSVVGPTGLVVNRPVEGAA